jgi:chemotaxis receptor (MCP) glutamine deamidase CheD
MARKKLAEAGLELKSSDVGGFQGRKIYFDTDSGDVWVKRFRGNLAGSEEVVDVKTLLAMELKNYEK